MSEELEKEIEARLEFKKQEIITNLESRIERLKATSIINLSSQDYYLSLALNQCLGIVKKEFKLSCPYDGMAEAKRKEGIDKTIDKIMTKFFRKGSIPSKDRLNIERDLWYILNKEL